MTIPFNTSVFHDYDIRGTYPDKLNEDAYYILGRALASYIKGKEIAVGYDARLSSPSLSKALIRGITDQGTNVVDLGLMSTEMHYFASGLYRFDANAIVSASHNPPQYNGLKIVKAGAVPLHGGFGLPEIKQKCISQDFTDPPAKGTVRKMSVIDQWVKHALTFIDTGKLRKLKVVVDAGNGMAGISWDKIIGKYPLEIIPLFFNPDGHFPNHLPDPLNKNNLVSLKEAVLKNKADLGFAVDGDADRLFVIDDKGNMLSGTVTTAMLAETLLRKNKPAPVLYNVVCGKIVPETVRKYNAEAIRVRVGHSFIKEQMKKTGALFAGEHSGHFYFRDNFFADSSFIAGLLLLEFISVENKPLSDIAKVYEKYTSGDEINFKVDKPAVILEKVEEKYREADTIDHLDGLSVWYPDWWLNLRPSNTEPFVRLNVEADTKDLLAKRQSELVSYIESLGGKRE